MYKHLSKTALLIILGFIGSIGFAYANPTFPALSGRVVDQAGILSASAEAKLVEQLAAHEAKTSNQIVVVTVNSLEGYDVADYTVRLGTEWGIGTKEKDNGVILLVAPNERKVRIEVGYGLEGALPDALAGQIISTNILPAFKEGDYPRGIQSGADAIEQAVVGEYKAPPGGVNRPTSPGGISDFVPLIFMGIIVLSGFARSAGSQRLANASFPGAFAGLFGSVITGNFLIGLLIGIAAFGIIYATNPTINSGGPGGGQRRGGGFGGSGGGFGGGFSGGGGGFGGGGASGSW